MKFIYICLALLLGANYSYAATLTKRSIDDNPLFDAIEKLFKEKCQEEKNVTDVLKATRNCIKQYIPTNINDLKNSVNLNAMSQVCSDSKEALKLIKCFNEFNGLLEECTIPAEKYLKGFFMKAVGKAIDTICNGTTGAGGAALYRVPYTLNAIECFERMFTNYNTECNQQEIFPSHTTVSKSLLCGNLDQTKNCYRNYLSQQCPAANDLKKFFTEIMQSIKSPCLVPVNVTPKPNPVRSVYLRPTPTYVLDPGPIIRNNPLAIFSPPQTDTLVVAGVGLAGVGLAVLPAIPLLFG